MTSKGCPNPADISLSLYIHIPWCVKKCPYCDFNSHALTSERPGDFGTPEATPALFAKYTDCLLRDAQSQQALAMGRPLRSIFFGGGTPSLMPVDELGRLLVGLGEIFELSPDIEITLEANPGTLEHAPFAEYLAVGVNRLSVGVQSFDDRALGTLGRAHDHKQAMSAITAAREAGFERVNCDLMHGLPYQTAKLAQADLVQALVCGATHISWYQLTIEPNTQFFKHPPNLPPEDDLDAIEQAGRTYLLAQGFDNYEISAWVGQDSPCAHNLNYWQFGDYLAIGAGAHGKVTVIDVVHDDVVSAWEAGIWRFSRSRNPKDYMANPTKFVGLARIDTDTLAFEYMMNALRLRAGTSLENFVQTTALAWTDIKTVVDALVAKGLMLPVFDAQKKGHLQASALGYRHVNQLMQAFL